MAKKNQLPRNESTADRGIRGVIAAAALFASRRVKHPIARYGLMAVAAIAGGTAATGFCPLYKALGFKTCP